MSNFLQLSVKLVVCRYYGAFWTHTKIPVIALLIILRKFTKKIFPFTSFFPFFSENVSYPKASFLLFFFLPDVFYINLEPKLMMPEAVNDVCMPSLCFHKRIFSSKFGDNVSLVGMSWQ